nr:unnamed protein product [Callosobruchus chinensis]
MSQRFKLLNKLQFTLQKVFKRKPVKDVPVVEKDKIPEELDARAFLKEKPKTLPKEKIQLVDVKEKTTAEIECLAYESEEQLCAVTERERDASVRSRLSKECEKIRLNYHVAVGLVNQRIRHKNLVQWVHKEVLGALSPELHDKIINISIDNIIAELERNKPKDD